MRRLAGLAAAAAIALATIGAPPTAAAGYTVGEWHYNTLTRHFYAQVDGVNWADGEAYARTLGGHLVTIEDGAENDWLIATFPQPWLWIGLNDVSTEGKWVWASGRKVAFTNWQDGEPDDWKGFDPTGEDAATLTSDIDPRWADISGRWIGSGIIEVASRPKDLGRNTVVTGTHDGTVEDVAFGDACYANGWAWDPDSAKRDVPVRIMAMRLDITSVPREVWRGVAAEFRDDLLANGISDGTAAFTVDLRGLIEYGLPYEIRVQGRDLQTGEWVSLDNTPRLLTCYP